MAPLVNFLPPVMLFLGLIFLLPVSSDKVSIPCEKVVQNGEPCPSYCPKDFRPNTLNNQNLWGVVCICCDTNKKFQADAENPQAFTSNMAVRQSNPQEVSLEARTKILKKLEELNKQKKIPPLEFSYWQSRINLTEDDLLSSDEVELLISMLVDSGVGWSSAFFLVHPLAAEQWHPVNKMSMRAGFGAQKGFSLDDLEKKLGDVIVPKVREFGALVESVPTPEF